jgi:autotransporter-associated beta strand protein
VGTGSSFLMGSQGISTAAGTGFIKNGAGVWATAGGAYTGGFTLNAGTLAVGGVNAMGAGGALTINGGTIRSNSTTARDLTGKYTGGITIGGDFALGDATNNGALTFTNNMALGAASRNITVNSAATLGGIISGTAPTLGLTKSGAGSLTLSGANTYSGKTTLAGGLAIANNNTAFSGGDIEFSGSATGLQLGSGVNLANNVTIGTNTGTAGHGLIKVANGLSATLSGTITINNLPSAGAHFGGLTSSGTGTLNVTGAINSTVNVSQRSGTVVLSGGGSYSNFDQVAGNLRIGADNGLSTSATLNISTSASPEAAAFDLNGKNQTLVGITKGSAASASNARIGNSSTTTDSTLTTTGTSSFGGIIQNAYSLGSGAATGSRTTALTVNGGSLTLTAANTYTGATNVTGNGTLLINGSISTSTTVTVDSGSTLGGSGGTVGGSTTVNGTLASGSSIGTLSFSNALGLGATSTYLFELNNTTDLADLTNVAGTLNIASGAILDLVQLGTYAVGDKFTLFGYATGNLTGTFSGLADGSMFIDAGGSWQINYSDLSAGVNGGTGTSFVTITAVPEPAAAFLGGLGMLALLRRRR